MARASSKSASPQGRPSVKPELIAIVHRTRELTKATGAAVALTTDQPDEIECCVRSGHAAPPIGKSLLVEDSLTALCIGSGKQLRSDNASANLGARCLVVTPIGRENQIIGALAVFADAPHLFSEMHLARQKTAAEDIFRILGEYRPQEKPAGAAPLDAAKTADQDVSQPKPPVSARADRESRSQPASENQLRTPEPAPEKPAHVSFGTFDALANLPKKPAAKKVMFIGAPALLVVAGGILLYLRQSGPAQLNSAQAGLHSSEVRSAGHGILSLTPAVMASAKGGTFTLSIVVSHGQDISSVPVQINYDPRVMRLLNVSTGSFLTQDGQQAILVHRDDPSTGILRINAQRPSGSSGASGEGTVFTLVFMAAGKGSGTVSIVPETGTELQAKNGLRAQVTVN